MATQIDALPRAFVWRRTHSLTGLWLVIFLIEHLVTNSQAALLLGDGGQGFVRMVNLIHDLPYLTVIEVGLLGIPLLIHMYWGIIYAKTSKGNSRKSDGSRPSLPLSRNRSYSLQRITSWLLVPLLIVHVAKFRFLEYPISVNEGTVSPSYLVKVTEDPGLDSVAGRLGARVYTAAAIEVMGQTLEGRVGVAPPEATGQMEALSKLNLKKGEVVLSASNFGTASLFSVRNTFKNPFWVAIYTLFVLSAVFHAFNGLWTSMLTWGWVIKKTAQTRARKVALALMGVIAFLGLAAVWGTYFLNLRH